MINNHLKIIMNHKKFVKIESQNKTIVIPIPKTIKLLKKQFKKRF